MSGKVEVLSHRESGKIVTYRLFVIIETQTEGGAGFTYVITIIADSAIKYINNICGVARKGGGIDRRPNIRNGYLCTGRNMGTNLAPRLLAGGVAFVFVAVCGKFG